MSSETCQAAKSSLGEVKEAANPVLADVARVLTPIHRYLLQFRLSESIQVNRRLQLQYPYEAYNVQVEQGNRKNGLAK